MDITIKESLNNIKDTHKKSGFAKFNIVEQLPSTNNLYDTYIIEKDEKNYKMNLFRFGESVNLDIFEELNNIKNVNHLVESGLEGDRHYLLWEVLDYPNLGEVEVPIDEFLKEIMSILFNLHEKKIYHLNLNLENIKVKNTNPLEIIIDDFASASITDAEASKKLTNVKGIDLFQSPELSLGIASSKSDYWSLGIILYYLLTKTLPEKNTYTKEIIITNIPAKYENLIKGLLSIDLNKRYGKEEIDIVLGGGKVEVDTKSTSIDFTYEGKRFNSLEDFALFLHNEKDGLDMFKKLLYRGYFDKYYDEVILSKLKNSLGELNAFFYRYGCKGQKPLFEEVFIYNPFLWFTHDKLKKMNYRDYSSIFISNITNKLIDSETIGKFYPEFQTVRNLINFDRIKPSPKALAHLKEVSNYNINSKVIYNGKKRETIKAVNYIFLYELVKEDTNLDFLRLALPYEEISKVPKGELAAYIQYKYIYLDFKYNGYSTDVSLNFFIPSHTVELKYYYKFIVQKEYNFSINKGLSESIIKFKKDKIATQYYLKNSDNNDLINEVKEIESCDDFLSYFCFLINNHINVDKNLIKISNFDKSIMLLSEVNNIKKIDFISKNLRKKDLEFLLYEINNPEKIKGYLTRIFKKNISNSKEKFKNFNYNIEEKKEESFKNCILALEDYLSQHNITRLNSLFFSNSKSIKNIFDNEINTFIPTLLSIISIVIIILLYKFKSN